MTSTIMRTLNAYPEWHTKEKIDGIIEYVTKRRTKDDNWYPNYVKTTRQERTFTDKFSKDWVVDDKRLFYNPSERLKIMVPYPDERQEMMEKLYKDQEKGAGLGLKAFYSQVCKYYLGITRKETNAFLRSRGNYHVSRDYKKRDYNRPVLSKTPNERWGLDLIDMTTYSNDHKRDGKVIPNEVAKYHNEKGEYKYIMTIVDYFSKYVWARGLMSKSADEVLRVLKDIIKSPGEDGGAGGTYPNILQTDNGGEFVNADMESFIKSSSIKTHIYTKPYISTSNALIENKNGTLRRKIRAGFLRHDDLEWYEHLPEYVVNMNVQKPTRGGYSAKELWSPLYTKVDKKKMLDIDIEVDDKSTKKEIIQHQQAILVKRAKKQMDRTEKPYRIFAKGDFVRVALTSLDNRMTKRHEKEGRGKLSIIKYTPEIFVVDVVYSEKKQKVNVYGKETKEAPPANKIVGAPNLQDWNIARRRYTLKTLEGDLFKGKIKKGSSKTLLERVKSRQFYGDELLKVEEDEVPPTVVEKDRYDQLNRVVDSYEPKETVYKTIKRRQKNDEYRQTDQAELNIMRDIENQIRQARKSGNLVLVDKLKKQEQAQLPIYRKNVADSSIKRRKELASEEYTVPAPAPAAPPPAPPTPEPAVVVEKPVVVDPNVRTSGRRAKPTEKVLESRKQRIPDDVSNNTVKKSWKNAGGKRLRKVRGRGIGEEEEQEEEQLDFIPYA